LKLSEPSVIAGAPSEWRAEVALGSFVQLLARIVRGRRTILYFTAVGLLAGGLLAWVLPPTFESTAGLMPPPQTSGGALLSAALGSRSGQDDQLSGLAASMLGVKTSGALFIGVLQSESAEDDLIQHFDLEKLYRKQTMEQTRKKLASRSSFSEDRRSGIITIRVQDHDKDRAHAMCQEYVNVLNRLIAQDSSSAARNEREFLENRLELAKKDLTSAELDFSHFAAKNRAIDIPEQTRATVGAAAALQGQLTAAEAELNGLRQIYAPQNARVLAAQGRVATLRSKLEQLAGTSGQSDGVDGLISPALEQLPSVGVGYEDLYRNFKLQESLFTELSTQYELAKVEEAKETPTVRVLDPPSLPEKRTAPVRALLVAGLAVFMLLAGCTWVIVSSAWNSLAPIDPRKQFVQVAWSELRSDLLRFRSMFSAKSGRLQH
jgi:uncharacterized protein involved in exopolysaccharide biosynthesis